MQNRLTNTRSTPRLQSTTTRIPKYFSSIIPAEIKPISPKNSYELIDFPGLDSSKDVLSKKTIKMARAYSNPFSLTSQTPRAPKPFKDPLIGSKTPRSNSYKSLTPRVSSINSRFTEIQPKQSTKLSTKSLSEKVSRSPSSAASRKNISQSVSATNLSPSLSSDSLGSPKSNKEAKSILSQMVTQVKTIDHSKISREISDENIKRRADAIYKEHLFQTFQALKFVRTLPASDPNQLNAKRVNLTKRSSSLNKKTLVFDLDETLVHCCEDTTTIRPDVVLPIMFPNGEVINVNVI